MLIVPDTEPRSDMELVRAAAQCTDRFVKLIPHLYRQKTALQSIKKGTGYVAIVYRLGWLLHHGRKDLFPAPGSLCRWKDKKTHLDR